MNTTTGIIADFIPEKTQKNIEYIFDYPFDLHKVEESGSLSTKYHLEINEHIYYVGIYIYLILSQIKIGKKYL